MEPITPKKIRDWLNFSKTVSLSIRFKLAQVSQAVWFYYRTENFFGLVKTAQYQMSQPQFFSICEIRYYDLN